MTGVAALPAIISEDSFQRCVIDLARHRGWKIHHARPSRTASGSWATALTGHPGLPDLVLARAGVVLLAELKTQRGRLTPGQREWLTDLGEHGRCWRPTDWNAIVSELSAPRGMSDVEHVCTVNGWTGDDVTRHVSRLIAERDAAEAERDALRARIIATERAAAAPSPVSSSGSSVETEEKR